jgi:2-oxo-4-hydroxy-4-carboxy-5-ureidoimidazoline decarboxylase
MSTTGTQQTREEAAQAGVCFLNALEPDDFIGLMLDTCHLPVRGWSEKLEAARPFEDLQSMVAVAQSLVRQLDDEEVVQAHAGLTPLGERRATSTDRQARWSKIESAGIQQDQDTLEALAEANRRYHDKFGHVFLISAAGLDSSQMLAAMHRRLDNDRATENEEVRGELCKLVALRLERLAGELG